MGSSQAAEKCKHLFDLKLFAAHPMCACPFSYMAAMLEIVEKNSLFRAS